MLGKKHLIKKILETFQEQIHAELQIIDNAVTNSDFAIIKNSAHSMKSTVSIMGIAALIPILQEMGELGKIEKNIEKIKELNQKLTLICRLAIEEIKSEIQNYV
jgi:HPt (histidine-containing phosphotransfer) domain-containing protein